MATSTINDNLKHEIDVLKSKLSPMSVVSLYANTTKDAVDADLRQKAGSTYFYIAFAILYQMTDGTDGGYYLIWRNTNMSMSTKFIKLG